MNPILLPVIISGAGPCGLMAAAVLQRHNVPFVLVERANESRLTADVGSGFDMAPTAIRLFDRLGLPRWKERMSSFVGVSMMRMNGERIRTIPAADLPGGEACAAKRSALQRCLMEHLGDALVAGRTARFGAAVTGYAEAADGVTVRLSTGATLEGRALLACDGWRSTVRRQLLGGGAGRPDGGDPDPVHFCGVAMWWGACDVDAELDALLEPTQALLGGNSFCWFMGDGGQPGNFVGAIAEGEGGTRTFLWSAAQRCDADPAQSDDLTVRGGVRGEAVKAELEEVVAGRCALIQKAVAATDAAAVTKVGLYDREDLDHKMVSPGGRVALLGDAAHPQTPFQGQGCNMALADAFAVCTRLGAGPGGGRDPDGAAVRAALACLDAPRRRSFVKETVLQARKFADLSTSHSSVGNFFARQFMRVAPASVVFPRVDDGNRVFVNEALQHCGLSPLPESLDLPS